MKRFIAIVMVLSFGFAGCITGNAALDSTIGGALFGAGGGAAIGAIAGDAGKGAAIGSIVGGAGGLLHGLSQERQNSRGERNRFQSFPHSQKQTVVVVAEYSEKHALLYHIKDELRRRGAHVSEFGGSLLLRVYADGDLYGWTVRLSLEDANGRFLVGSEGRSADLFAAGDIALNSLR